MIAKAIIFFEQKAILICDAQCDKAWGINNRPKNELSNDPDDYEYLTDQELEDAPCDPGTYEGGHAKPTERTDRLNKWCARECERSKIVNQVVEDFYLKDFTKRIKNLHPSAA
jgi:hypothetical protein